MPDHAGFHGVLPALITPFSDDRAAIDADALTANVERLINVGVAGLVPGGSTGEFTTLTHAERRELIELTVAAAAGRVPVVPGTGALSTRETVELSVHAERSGAGAVMIVPPFYDPLGWRELLAHYAAVAEEISIPIMYYNLPSASGVTLDAGQLRQLRDESGSHVAEGHRRRCRRGYGAHPSRRPRADPAQRLGHPDLRRARRRRARRGLGNRLHHSRAVRRAPPPPHRRHRPPRRPRPVGPPLAALQVPGGPQLPGGRQDRMRTRRRHHGSDTRSPLPLTPDATTELQQLLDRARAGSVPSAALHPSGR